VDLNEKKGTVNVVDQQVSNEMGEPVKHVNDGIAINVIEHLSLRKNPPIIIFGSING